MTLHEPTPRPVDGAATPSTAATPADVVDTLRAHLRGRVLTPDSEEYATKILGWNRAQTHRPCVVVLAEDAEDVALSLRAARAAGLGVGVMSTGHGAVVPIDGLMIVVSGLQDLSVDPATATARIGAGCTWAQVLAATQERGLAPQIGSSVTVGAVGFTLGGGLGWLSRKYGPACDAVRSFDVVTPDGRLVRAAANEHHDLFRALRGGGGGALGVVVAMEIELHPVTEVYAGNLFYPTEAAAEVAGRYARWVAESPDELTSSLVFMNFPPIPEVPEHLRGGSFLIVRGCWCGDIDRGRDLLDEWRRLAPPMIDTWDALPFSQAASISNDPVEPMPCVDTGGWLADFDTDTATTVAARTFPVAGPPPVMFTEVRHLGGAVARNDRSLSTMGNRDRQFLVHSIGIPLDPAEPVRATPGQVALMDALAPHLAAGTYHNFLDGAARRRSTGTSVDAAARPALTTLQGELDPDGMLRYGVDHRG
ncbi:MAG: FAD-binding oxidoreductase [Microthrixaceae bacterium]